MDVKKKKSKIYNRYLIVNKLVNNGGGGFQVCKPLEYKSKTTRGIKVRKQALK